MSRSAPFSSEALPVEGPRARVGVGVPRANPTVEGELRALVPRAISVHATRLSRRAPRLEERLLHFIRHLGGAIDTFGAMDIRAFGFACAGSSYLAGREIEDEPTALAWALTRAAAPELAPLAPLECWSERSGARALSVRTDGKSSSFARPRGGFGSGDTL